METKTRQGARVPRPTKSHQEPLRPVIASTSQKFCVFGYTRATPEDTIITLYRSRLVIYWSEATAGLWGLAAAGPAQGSKVSGECTATFKGDVLFMLECSPEAEKAFAAYPVFTP